MPSDTDDYEPEVVPQKGKRKRKLVNTDCASRPVKKAQRF